MQHLGKLGEKKMSIGRANSLSKSVRRVVIPDAITI